MAPLIFDGTPPTGWTAPVAVMSPVAANPGSISVPERMESAMSAQTTAAEGPSFGVYLSANENSMRLLAGSLPW